MALWSAVGALATIGATSAVARGLMLWGVPGVHLQANILAEHFGITALEIASYEAKFVDHPVLTATHIGAGLIYLLLAPLQFSSRIRLRHLQIHRRSGRLLVAVGILFGLSGLVLGLFRAYGGPAETSATTTFGVVFLGALGTAVSRIRNGDVIGHRAWMIRAFGAAFGIAVVRVVLPVYMTLTHTAVRPAFGPSLWIGWLLSACAAELWLRYAPSSVSIGRGHVSAPRIPF